MSPSNVGTSNFGIASPRCHPGDRSDQAGGHERYECDDTIANRTFRYTSFRSDKHHRWLITFPQVHGHKHVPDVTSFLLEVGQLFLIVTKEVDILGLISQGTDGVLHRGDTSCNLREAMSRGEVAALVPEGLLQVAISCCKRTTRCKMSSSIWPITSSSFSIVDEVNKGEMVNLEVRFQGFQLLQHLLGEVDGRGLISLALQFGEVSGKASDSGTNDASGARIDRPSASDRSWTEKKIQ